MKLTRLGAGCAMALVTLAASHQLAAQQTRSQWNGVYSDAQAKRGGALYADNCIGCHMKDLFGSDRGPALAGAGFAGRWDKRPLSDLYDYTQAFMPYNSPGGLNRKQNADILAYMLQVGKYPAGSAELPADSAAMGGITFKASK